MVLKSSPFPHWFSDPLTAPAAAAAPGSNEGSAPLSGEESAHAAESTRTVAPETTATKTSAVVGRSALLSLECRNLAGFNACDAQERTLRDAGGGDNDDDECQGFIPAGDYRIQVDFGSSASQSGKSNLAVVTGETGSGKSLLVRKAVELLRGGKVAAGMVPPPLVAVRAADIDGNGEEEIDAAAAAATAAASVEMTVLLEEPQLSATLNALRLYGLDSSSLLQGDRHLCVHRTFQWSLTPSTRGKTKTLPPRLKSSCYLNGQSCTLKALEAVVGPIVAVVDAPAASHALAKPEARLAVLDAAAAGAASSFFSSSSSCSTNATKRQGAGKSNPWLWVRQAQLLYKERRAERERLQEELEQRILPARYGAASYPLASAARGGSDDAAGQEAELLRHWVDELDGFERRVLDLAGSLAAADYKRADEDDEEGPRGENNGEGNGASGVRLSRLARDIAAMKWTEAATIGSARLSSRRARGGSASAAAAASSALWEGLTDYRDTLASLERQLSDARAALDRVGSLSSKDSAATAVERARELLAGQQNAPAMTTKKNRNPPLPPTASRAVSENSLAAMISTVSTKRNNALSVASERAHDLLHSIEDSIAEFCRLLEDDEQGLIQLLESELSQSRVSKDSVDGLLHEWTALARKHGISPGALPMCHSSLREELMGNVRALALLPAALEEEKEALENFEAACAELSKCRMEAASWLSRMVTERLPSLGMEQAVFEAVVNPQARKCTDPGAYNSPGSSQGLDSVEFVLAGLGGSARGHGRGRGRLKESGDPASSHPEGPTRGPVHAVASSGEKARLLLCLECAVPGSIGMACRALAVAPPPAKPDLASASPVSVPPVAVLYDEIDAHVGGRAAVALSRLLLEQSEKCQVIAITHNPSLAASGDVHLVVRRQSRGRGLDQSAPDEDPGRRSLSSSSSSGSFVSVVAVGGAERRKELARMASGDLAPEEAAAFAEALIRDARGSGQDLSPREQPRS